MEPSRLVTAAICEQLRETGESACTVANVVLVNAVNVQDTQQKVAVWNSLGREDQRPISR